MIKVFARTHEQYDTKRAITKGHIEKVTNEKFHKTKVFITLRKKFLTLVSGFGESHF